MPSPDFRSLPSVTAVLEALGEEKNSIPPALATELIRQAIDQARQSLILGETATLHSIVHAVRLQIDQSHLTHLRRVINATGIVLHTNLGRSILNESAAAAVQMAATGYLNLELDLESGQRSHRSDAVRHGIRQITGAEQGTVVNNCAAATVIVLRALAAGREVIVSRGQLIEIGGSFRIPEIMTVSGATLREVGTTNITRIADFEQAIGPNTGLLMRIHTSNFRVSGFTKSVSLDELVALGRKHSIPVVDDVGSGLVIPFGDDLSEPQVSEGIRAGADLVLFSGDKLLGGPQAGIIAGRADLIATIERDPLMRAFRCDKMTLAALEATLRQYRDPTLAIQEIPTLRMLSMRIEELRNRSERFENELKAIPAIDVSIRDDVSFAGGGSLPDRPFPTVVVTLACHSRSESEIASRLRMGQPAVMARINDGRVLFDLRTVLPEQETELVNAIREAVG